jgi:hypothetical protein
MATIQDRFLLRRGLSAALVSTNQVPLDGEIYYATDTRTMKIGDGVTPYNSLPFYAGGSDIATIWASL